MRRIRLWKSPLCRLALAVCLGLLWVAGGAVLCAAGLLLGNMPEWLLAWISTLLWCVGAFRAADCFAWHTRRGGIGSGLLCSGMLCAVLLIGAYCMEGVLWHRILLRCLLLTAAGICGGICGVNRKITRPPY